MKRPTLAVILLVIIFLIWWQPLNFGKAEISIPRGTNGREVVEYLLKSRVVRDRNEFLLWLKISGQERHLKSGTYELQKYSNPIYLISQLVQGGKSEIIVTIPEGLTIYETAEILDAKAVINKKEFIRLCQTESFARFLGLAGSSLEGYLFPDTYSFSSSESDTDIIKTFITNFNNHIQKLNLAKGDSTQQIMILASLVEKEAKYADERPIIAKVFINRLKAHRPLESCATIHYILKTETRDAGAQNQTLTERDLKIQSPYNTYLHLGLPPGPICSPGASSIEAVLTPADVDYLYFVAKGDGRHYFSKSYKEHLIAKGRYNETR